jgi:beta-galactosidase
MRALVDNDLWLRKRNLEEPGGLYVSGLTQLRYHPRPIAVKPGVVTTSVLVTGSKSAGFTHETQWRFSADGSVSATHTVIPHGTMPDALPRLGCSWKLNAALQQMSWYGRGPYENYIDRLTGSFFGLWSSTVKEQFEAYVRPQDNGYKSDVRWVEFVGKDGKGVRFSADVPLFVSASHYGWEDLEFARHRRGQQRMQTRLQPQKDICLNLDVRQLGLGGASCGPKPMDKYIFKIQKETWTVRLDPVAK